MAIKTDNAMNIGAVQKKVPFAVTEAYKCVRTNIVSMLERENKKTVVITSPNASEGKSTTSINTAISISQLNLRVLLIDADAHRPSVHRKLRLDNGVGLAELINGTAKTEEAIKHYNASLDVITSGALPQNATEMFSMPAFDDLLEAFKNEYDCVILDAPPANLLSDALVIGQKTDGMILVIRAGATTHENLRRTLSSAETLNINIMGVILNGSAAGSKNYYKKCYSSYNGKYSY